MISWKVKSAVGNRRTPGEGDWGYLGAGMLLNRMAKQGLIAKVTFKQRLEGVEGLSHGDSGRDTACAKVLR